jgi:type II secretory ATPase GspE/PulE/Tfp pilus assembly ATPase PilB-like protein
MLAGSQEPLHMSSGRPPLGQILLLQEVVTEEDLNRALEHQLSAGIRIGQALIALGFCSYEDIARALSEQLDMPFVDLYATPPPPDFVRMLPRELALEHGALPIRMEGDRLLVVVRDPLDLQADGALRRALGLPIVMGTAPENQIRDVLHQYYTLGSLLASSPDSLGAQAEVHLIAEQQYPVEKLIAAGEHVSIVNLVNSVIVDAVQRRASDVHMRPDDEGLRIRYRVDGQMCSVATFQRSVLPSVVARVKIMTGMDISDCRRPQDGSCRVSVQGRHIEIRASSLPSVHGETVVLRILSNSNAPPGLDMLGLDPPMLRELHRGLALKSGILLVAGPTGSGKTTTLYSALTYLNRDTVDVVTVEDPVEMRLPEVTQVQVDDRAGRSFAQTLRAMLRQDPDIMMVGEIRDGETADVACRAALTGHLVLSTLHARHALGTVARLRDLGVPPYMLAGALNGVLAQRLSRRICEQCAEEYLLPSTLERVFESYYGPFENRGFRRGAGCSKCHYTGTHGRIGVYEYLAVDEELRRLLAENVETAALRRYLEQRGFRRMEEDAFEKARQGLIAPEEVVELGLGVALDPGDEPGVGRKQAGPGANSSRPGAGCCAIV